MDAFRTRRHLSEILIFAFLAVATPGSLVAQQKAGVTEITPTLLVFATTQGTWSRQLGRMVFCSPVLGKYTVR